MVGRCNFSYYYLLIKRPGLGVDTGPVGLVETRVFFFLRFTTPKKLGREGRDFFFFFSFSFFFFFLINAVFSVNDT